MNLCKYRHVFGKENEGVHSIRFFNLAVIDCVFTIIFGVIISYVYKYNFVLVLSILIISSVFIHRIFCVQTTLTNIVFSPSTH